jgi:cytochrome c2
MKVRIAIAVATLACVTACKPSGATKLWAANATGGDPDKGKQVIMKYGCVACHTIDGVRQSQALVGPPLTRMAGRSYLAGNLQNSAANIVRFIQHPKQVHSDTAMPEMGVTDQDAKDMAAYLYCFH